MVGWLQREGDSSCRGSREAAAAKVLVEEEGEREATGEREGDLRLKS